MKSSNIIIVSNKKDVAKKIMSKIVLLRFEDSVSVCSYHSIVDFVTDNEIDLILLYAESSKDTEIISKIKTVSKNTNIIVISETDDSELLCRAFDEGIDDYINIDTPETLFLMRVMWALKRKTFSDSSEKKSDILSLSKILDKNVEFYKKEYTNKLFDKEFKSILNSNDKTSYLVMLTASMGFSAEELANNLKRIMRLSDIGGFSSDEKIYLILRKTSKEGVKKFFERLKKIAGEKVLIFASAINISDKSYADSLTILNHLLSNAVESGADILFEDDCLPTENTKNEIGTANTPSKNLIKKIEKIIHPAFFKMSAIYEPKFFNTKVIQSVGKSQSSFTFKSNLCYAQVSLSYGNSDKITVEIDCIFYGKEKVEVCDIKIEELTGDLLENIIQSVATRYKKALDNKE